MLFGKERRKVASVIRDLVVRPRLDLQPSDGDLGGGLQMLARVAASPLGLLPQAAARMPAVLRELGERRRAIPAARRVSPDPVLAVQAMGGCLSGDDTKRTRYMNLLAASMDRATARQVHPGFLAVLRQVSTDEIRIFSLFEGDGPYPVISIQSRPKHGGDRRTELRNFSLLGEEARCDTPSRVPLYLDNLCRLGLTELRPTRLTEDTRMFKALEDHPEVTSLIARIGSRPNGDPLVADIQYKYLFVTSFGRQFYV